MYWRFAWDLRRFLRDPITVEQSRQIIRRRLEEREQNLLALARKAVYGNQDSPHLKLLQMAGCQYGDFERMVRSDGVESALRQLLEAGVYLSYEEFKRGKEVVRGGHTFRFKESDFDNTLRPGHLEEQSGGSRSAATRTIYDFEFLTTNWTVYELLMLDAYDSLQAPLALWAPIMPGYGPAALLLYAKAGIPPVKWFSPVESRGFKPSLKNRLGTNYIVYAGRLLGAGWPGPEFVSLDEAETVARWMADVLKEHGKCSMVTYSSAAVRACQAAKEKGLRIAGTEFIMGGDPITEAKRREIESAGAIVRPTYGFSEGGCLGAGCSSPAAADDVHFFKDSFAAIERTREVPHALVSVDALLITTLLPSAPKVLLNVEIGDCGDIETGHCGCELEKMGLTDHIHDIRGFDKLTGEGMTFVGTDLVRVIEEVLPAKFGGGPTDYQMVEEEDEKGHTRMTVIVNPEVGPVDEVELVQIVLAELGKGEDGQRMMSRVWTQAETLRVKRTQPFVTARGKLMPLHIHKKG